MVFTDFLAHFVCHDVFHSSYQKLTQVAQNRAKVARNDSLCEDTTFVDAPLKNFLFTLRLRSRYLKGTPELALYASKKIGTIRCTDRIILKEK